MDRRSFLKTTTAAAASTATVGAVHASPAVASPAITAARTQIRVAADPAVADAARRLTRDIGIASDGRIAIEFVEATATAKTIGAGHCDAAFGYLSEICAAPEMSLFSGLPGPLAVSPEILLAWHISAGGDLYLEEVAAGFDLMAVLAGHSGAGTGLWASAEIDGLAEFAAAEISTVGLGRPIADRISEAFGQAPTAAGRQSLVEVTLPPMEAFLNLPAKSRQVWYRDGLHAQGFAATLVLSRATWDKLSASDQLLIAALARAATHGDILRARVNDRMHASFVMNSLPIRLAPLASDIVQAIQHTAIDLVHQAMSRQREISQAFEAYGAFYKAMLGAPLPAPGRTLDPSV